MKRHVGFGAVLLGTFLSATLATVLSTASAQTEIRLGYQRGDFTTVMIEQGLLDARFGPDVTDLAGKQVGYTVGLSPTTCSCGR